MTTYRVVKYGRPSADAEWHREVAVTDPNPEKLSAQHCAEALADMSAAHGNRGYVRFEVEEI